MSSDLRIADVAARAGITTATVRYYERIGVLPSPVRADNGYRTYDDRTVERLAFIRRAKHLGCTLDEISDLTTAWDGGECGPIQDRLRSLVTDKLALAQREIIDLVTVTADLRRAAAALERHRPTGSCDERCGCINDPLPSDPTPAEHPISLTPTRNGARDETVACMLPANRLAERVEQWNRLLADNQHVLDAAVSRTAIEGGLRLGFRAGIDAGEIARLAAAEQDCCRFFSFTITIDRHGLALDITAPDDGLPAVHALFGAPT